MSCLDNTDILRIVGGNSFQIAITVKARRVADGSEIEDFDLSASSPVLNLIHAGEKTQKYFVTQGNQAIISFDGSEGLGYYGMEMSGSYNSEAWRFCIENVLQLVDTNAKANIPEWSFLVDDTYFIEGTVSIYGGGGGGDTVQADWTETNPTSAAFILHKPDLSVYATKSEVASGLAGKQDTIVDLTSIRYGAAAGATAYQKPVSGIPESDMSEGVQSALDKAEDAYQKPSSGIPATDMSEGVQAALEKANSAVQTESDPVFSGSPAAEITQADINAWNAKQSAIADLADIRDGAAAGATAVQPDEMAQAIDVVDGDIDAINAKIPSAASNLNQLADKAYVNSSIATNSATYRGSFNLITDLGMNVDATHAQIAGALATAIVTADNNDYAFVQVPDSASTPTVIAKIERYKHNGSGWVYEYDLNNSGFTAAQWAAINSGITSGLVGKLADLPNNSELATLLNGKQNVINDLSAIRSGASAGATAIQPADLTDALNGVEAEIAGLDESKQDTIEDLSTIRSGAAAGATAYQKPVTGIPESDMSDGVQTSLGKADSAYQKPVSGIPATDMSESVQESLARANSAVQTETDPVFSNSPAAEITQTDINNWNAKQPAIADLADIREGAAAGATAVQPDEMAQAIDVVDGDIADINAKIPAAASNLNQLADKAYVNSSIATNSATYRGSFNLITDLGMNVDATHAQIAGALATAIVTADNNDYAFVQIPDSASTPTVIAKIERYKHNGTGWVYEYDLNNSGFTAAQWAAINSGITSGLVGKLADLPNNSELATLLNGKQNVINDLATIRSGASAGATAYQKPSSGIPASDMSSAVQTELSKANTAVQTETDPIFSASPAAGITAQNIQTWNGEPAARQAADTALQNSVSTLQTDLAAETSARQSADAALQTAIQDEATARATADELLQQQYNALTQSDTIVGALPASGVANVIYRVPGTTNFSDYMWYNGQFVLMATYGLPISAEFVIDNNMNKTQEEVNEEVNRLESKLNGISVSDVNNPGISSSYWTDNNGVVGYASSVMGLHRVNYQSVYEGDNIEIYTALGATSAAAGFFCDDSDTIIQTIARTGETASFTGTVPSGATRLYLNYMTTYEVSVTSLSERVDEIKDDVDDLTGQVDGLTGQVDGLTGQVNYIITDNIKPEIGWKYSVGFSEDTSYWKGSVGSAISYAGATYLKRSVGYVSVNSGEQYVLKNGGGNGLQNNAAYIITDSNDIIIESVAGEFVSYTHITIPTQGKRIYFNVNKDHVSDFSFASEGKIQGIEQDLTNLKPFIDVDYLVDAPVYSGTSKWVDVNGYVQQDTSTSLRRFEPISIPTGVKVQLKFQKVVGITYNVCFFTDDTAQILGVLDESDKLVEPPAGSTKMYINNGNTSNYFVDIYLVGGSIVSVNEESSATSFLSIYAPSPQLPANNTQGSDFNCETVTSQDFHTAFEDLIADIPGFLSNSVRVAPKTGNVFEKVGTDASGQLSIKSYVFGRRNRYAWKAADRLYAYKNGSTIVYIDSCSPFVGSPVYSSSDRTLLGATISSYDGSTSSFSASNGVTYTRDASSDVNAIVGYTTVPPNISGSGTYSVFSKTGSFLGSGTLIDATHLSLSSTIYARCESLDYHTEHKGTIVLWANEHGPSSDPCEPSVILYRMAKDITEGCRNNPFLQYLWKYFRIVLIPAANPYGVNYKRRNNYNNVNINRNYNTPGWYTVSDADKGSYPGDQPETQYIMNTVKFFDADIAIDIHCLGYVAQKPDGGYYPAGRTHFEGVIPGGDDGEYNLRVLNTMGELSCNYTTYGNGDYESGSQGADWLNYENITGGLIEMTPGEGAASFDGKQHTARIMFIDYTLLLNTLRVWLSGFDSSTDLSNIGIW